MRTYAPYIFRGAADNPPPFTANMLLKHSLRCGQSALGHDGWAFTDFDLLSKEALGLLADLLNAIVQGAPWPRAVLQPRAVFLPKTADAVHNPMAYRIFKTTSSLFRLWATARLRQPAPWIRSWDGPALNAGVLGKGTPDNWHTTAIEIDAARLDGACVAGGSLDVFNCFNQFNRPLIFQLAEAAGMPLAIFGPYRRFITSFQMRFQLNRAIGRSVCENASLPQGCPFSMAMAALLMRLWLHAPRCLADDLLIYAIGHKHLTRYVDAIKLSRQNFIAIGARIADRCFSFADDPVSRQALARYVWDDADLHMAVGHKLLMKTLFTGYRHCRRPLFRPGSTDGRT